MEIYRLECGAAIGERRELAFLCPPLRPEPVIFVGDSTAISKNVHEILARLSYLFDSLSDGDSTMWLW